MKKTLNTLLFIFISAFSFSQDGWYRVSIDPGLIYSYRTSSFRGDTPLKDYLDVNRHHAGAQLGIKVFINENIGVSFRGENISGFYNSTSGFFEAIANHYAPEHYLLEPNVNRFQRSNDEQNALSIGAFYKFIQHKWSFEFGLDVGVRQLHISYITGYLKAHGKNEYELLELGVESKRKTNVFFEPSFSVGFAVGKRMDLFLACTYQMSSFQVNYIEERTDLYTSNFNSTFNSEKTFHQLLSLKFGLHIGLGKRIEK